MILPARWLGLSIYGGTRLVTTSVPMGTGATTVADTATTSVILPRPHGAQCQLLGLSMQLLIAGASAGAVTVQAFKRDNSGTPADRTLTATKSIKSDIVTTLQKSYAIAITSTSLVNLTFVTGDICRLDFVAAGAVTTQPTMIVTGTWALVKP